MPPSGCAAGVSIGAAYRTVRTATEELASGLTPEDCTVQSMPDASPVKWHLAHTTWFFETIVLETAAPDHRPFMPEMRVLFNSYYNSIGEQHPRPRRGLLTRPTLEEVHRYREHVDARMQELWDRTEAVDGALAAVIEVGLHHEQQHQELILTDLKHLLACNPLRPIYRPRDADGHGVVPRLRWHRYDEGLHAIGHEGEGFAYDNERPRHRIFAEAFELASRPVANGEFQEFIDDGGYHRAELWLDDGWSTVRSQGWRSPLYWERDKGDAAGGEGSGSGWRTMTLSGMRPVDPAEPVTHISFYEADAYARWAGARLPSEAEWEISAGRSPIRGNFVESERLHPAPCEADAETAHAQAFGDVWEWTASAHAPYPGYRPPPGALGEYNSKFMCSQLVLRGGSCATPLSHIRPTYRNFFYPHQRWQFTGIRLAR